MIVIALNAFDLIPSVHENDTKSSSAKQFKSLNNDHSETVDPQAHMWALAIEFFSKVKVARS